MLLIFLKQNIGRFQFDFVLEFVLVWFWGFYLFGVFFWEGLFGFFLVCFFGIFLKCLELNFIRYIYFQEFWIIQHIVS